MGEKIIWCCWWWCFVGVVCLRFSLLACVHYFMTGWQEFEVCLRVYSIIKQIFHTHHIYLLVFLRFSLGTLILCDFEVVSIFKLHRYYNGLNIIYWSEVRLWMKFEINELCNGRIMSVVVQAKEMATDFHLPFLKLEQLQTLNKLWSNR